MRCAVWIFLLARAFWHRQRTVRTVLHGVRRTVSHGADRKRCARGVFALGATLTGAVGLGLGGHILQLRIMLTDSSAPAGIYRLSDAPLVRGALVAACLPAAIARTGLTRGYLQAGDCPGGAEPVAKVLGALPGDVVKVAPDGRGGQRRAVREQCHGGARQHGPAARARGVGHAAGGRRRGLAVRFPQSRGAGMRATSARCRWPPCAARCGRS